MSELQEKLLEIKRQKDTYIIPENLKKNITVLGVTGTLEPDSGGGDVKLFETIEDMQEDENPQEGDLAIVYREGIQSVTEESEFDSCIFPNEVVLDEAISGNIYGEFRSTGSSDFDGMVSMSSSGFIFNSYGDVSSNIRVEYTSSDGITYIRTDGGEELHEFGITIKWSVYEEPWNDVIGNFIKISGMLFEGLYEYKTNQYVIADSQLTLSSSNQLLPGITGYGKNGITVGNLGTNVSTAFNDNVAKIYAKAQIVYNDMTPLVASNNNKRAGLSDNIVLVPCKSDGTPLLDTSNVTNMNSMFRYCYNLIEVSSLNTSNAISMNGMFFGCESLIIIPQLNTSNVTNMDQMFFGCTSLKSIPLLDTSNATTMNYMFRDCTSLSNESLNNVLAMCTNATSYTGTKTLKYIGINTTQATTCQSLSNYSAFTAAGWTTGY